MKLAKADIYSQASSIPTLKFEEQQLTSFAGLVVFQKLFESCRLKARLQEACAHLPPRHYYSFSTILQCLIVHIVLGYRQLRESEFYREDPLVKRVLGLRWLPSVPTVSRMLSEFDDKSVGAQQALSRGLVLERLEKEALHTVTLDFDGSVQSTKRHAEGTAVGFNKEKKGARSYYPLFCTVAQTGQVLDVLHRSGNVHDAKGWSGIRDHLRYDRAGTPPIGATGDTHGLRFFQRRDGAVSGETWCGIHHLGAF